MRMPEAISLPDSDADPVPGRKRSLSLPKVKRCASSSLPPVDFIRQGVLVQFENTPKAFANFSLGIKSKFRINPERVPLKTNPFRVQTLIEIRTQDSRCARILG